MSESVYLDGVLQGHLTGKPSVENKVDRIFFPHLRNICFVRKISHKEMGPSLEIQYEMQLEAMQRRMRKMRKEERKKNYIQICMYLEYMPDYIHMYICRGKTGLELSGVFNCLGLQFLCVLFGLHFGLLCTCGEIHSWDTRDKNAHASGHLWRCPCQCRLLSIVVVWPPLLQLVGTRWTESLQELCNNIAT